MSEFFAMVGAGLLGYALCFMQNEPRVAMARIEGESSAVMTTYRDLAYAPKVLMLCCPEWGDVGCLDMPFFPQRLDKLTDPVDGIKFQSRSGGQCQLVYGGWTRKDGTGDWVTARPERHPQ